MVSTASAPISSLSILSSHALTQAAGVSQHSLYEWKRKFASSNAKSSDEAEEIRTPLPPRTLKNFPAAVAEIAGGSARGKAIEVWFQVEARVGQKNYV